jgi:hypothetical protein
MHIVVDAYVRIICFPFEPPVQFPEARMRFDVRLQKLFCRNTFDQTLK